MNCKSVHKKIWKYLEKDLSPEENQNMHDHMQSCNNCQQLFAQISKTYQMITKEEKADFDPYFFTRLEARMEKDLLNKSAQPNNLVPILKYAFASFLIVLSISAGAILGRGFKNQDLDITNDNITYVDQYTNDYYMFEMENELIETILLNE